MVQTLGFGEPTKETGEFFQHMAAWYMKQRMRESIKNQVDEKVNTNDDKIK